MVPGTRTLPLVLAVLVLLDGRGGAQSVTRLSVDALGNESNALSGSPAFSFDGRCVAFESQASNLVAGDANGLRDVFVADLALGTLERVNVSSSGAESDDFCSHPALSHDGRFVVFHGSATTLVPGDPNPWSDVFLRDRLLGTTRVVSLSSTGGAADGMCAYATISADGRWVAFSSLATNLVAGDSNGTTDVYLRDVLAGTTQRVSVSSAGAQADGYSTFASISADGRFVAFQSVATNLVAGDGNGQPDVFVHDRLSGTTQRASLSGAGLEGDGASTAAALSADARFVAFQSWAANLVAGDTNATDDVFVRDLVLGTTRRASESWSGGQGDQPSFSPAISGDGRFVAFVALSDFLVPGDINGVRDVLLRDLLTGGLERASVDRLGLGADDMSLSPALSADGARIAFQSFATNLVALDQNDWADVFVFERGLVHPGTCAGDGSLALPCPCGNPGAAGHGCAHSALAAGGLLEAQGETYLDGLTLVAHDLPASVLTIFLQGDTFLGQGVLFGDGVRCVGGVLRRLYMRPARFGVAFAPDPFEAGLRAQAQALGDPLPPGSLRAYQATFRDPAPGFCPSPSGSTWNVTNAVLVQW